MLCIIYLKSLQQEKKACLFSQNIAKIIVFHLLQYADKVEDFFLLVVITLGIEFEIQIDWSL